MHCQPNRRYFLKASLGSALGVSLTGLFDDRAFGAGGKADEPAMIVLWMGGGPSQLDTFDPKPGHANGGPTKAISTNVTGVEFSENLPNLAKVADQLAVIRSMTSREGAHPRATSLLHTGYLPTASVRYPTLGSIVAKEVPHPECELPSFVLLSTR